MKIFFIKKRKQILLFFGILCVSIFCAILIFYGKQYLQELLSTKGTQKKIVEDLALVADTVALTYVKDSGETLLYSATQTQIEDGDSILYALAPSLSYQFSDEEDAVEIKSASGSFDQKKKIMFFSDNVYIKSKDIVIYSTKAQLFIEKDLLVFPEGALIERDNSSLKAQTLEWNVKTNALVATMLRIVYTNKSMKEN